jgi:hypothetical protein
VLLEATHSSLGALDAMREAFLSAPSTSPSLSAALDGDCRRRSNPLFKWN